MRFQLGSVLPDLRKEARVVLGVEGCVWGRTGDVGTDTGGHEGPVFCTRLNGIVGSGFGGGELVEAAPSSLRTPFMGVREQEIAPNPTSLRRHSCPTAARWPILLGYHCYLLYFMNLAGVHMRSELLALCISIVLFSGCTSVICRLDADFDSIISKSI